MNEKKKQSLKRKSTIKPNSSKPNSNNQNSKKQSVNYQNSYLSKQNEEKSVVNHVIKKDAKKKDIKKVFSYEDSYEEFEDLDYELMDKLNKGKLIKGSKTANNRKTNNQKITQGTAAKEGKASEGTKATNREKTNRNNRDGVNYSNRGTGYRIDKEAVNHRDRGTDNRRNRETGDMPGKSRSKRVLKPGECPYIRQCGGCNILKKSYEEELKDKQKQVEGLISKYCKVEPIIGMKNPRNYRNKVHVVFDHDRKGNPVSGVYEEGTHRVVPIEQCCIHNEKADAIIATIRSMLKSFKIKTYDEDSGYGLLRHVLVRTGYASGEIMVVLVLSSSILPSKNNFVKALRAKHPEITTVIINVNDKQTSMVLGDREQVIYGKGFIEDSLCNKVFRLSPKSFYQVNPTQTEVLYKKAIKLAELTGNETVIDAYCGIGTIGIIASDHAKNVIGVELNKDAVKDANINAKRNDAMNIEFYSNDAGVFMSQMAEQQESADVVFMDPPRSGSTEQFMDAVVQLKPKKVVYISCNPVTLERDLGYITKKGYKAVKAVPVDMFPWTGHVETVCCLQRVNS